MPVVHQLQPSFNNGEISPLLSDRVDYQKFVSSIKSGKNMFVHPQGGISNRAGTQMLGQAKDEYVRLIPFEFSSSETYMIEFGNGYCRFYTTNGQVIDSNNEPYEIESPFTTAELDKIRYCQSGDVMYIAWGGKPQTLTRYGHTDWRFADYDFKNGPFGVSTEEKKAKVNVSSGTSSANFYGTFHNTSSSVSIGGYSADVVAGPWELKTTSNPDIDLGYIAYVNNKFFVKSVSNSCLYVSDDLITFTAILEGENLKWSGGIFNPVSYGKNSSNTGIYFVQTTDNKIKMSFDLSSWTETNLPYTYSSSYSVSWEYAETPLYVNNTLFAISTFHDRSNKDGFKIYTSSDGISWTEFLVYYTYDASSSIYTGMTRPFALFYANGSYHCFGRQTALTTSDFEKNYQLSFSDLSGTYTISYSTNVPYCSSVICANNTFFASQGGYLYSFTDISQTANIIANNCNYIKQEMVFSDGTYFYYLEGYNFNNNTGGRLFKTVVANDHTSTITEQSYSNSGNILKTLALVSVSAAESQVRLESLSNIFTQNDVGRRFGLDCFFDSISSSAFHTGTSDTLTTTLGPYPSDGNFSIYTKGTWSTVNSIDICVSEDGVNWEIYKKLKDSNSTNYNIVYNGIDNINYVKVEIKNVTGDFNFNIVQNGFYGKLYCMGIQFISPQVLKVKFDLQYSGLLSFLQQSYYNLLDGLWYEGGNYPTEVDLYQDRIVWTTNSQLDATKISDYKNFGVSTDVTEDDAISVIIKDKKIDKINSIVSGKKLVVFSDDGNFVHSNDTFTPNSATFQKQGSTGGSDVKPIVVRDHIIYVQPMKQAMSDYAYNFETDGYAGQEITKLASHLFDNKTIKSLEYQQEPYSIIWVLQEEGRVLACTYMRQEQVLAWTPMDFGGTVHSIGVMSSGVKEELYLAVERKNGTFIEKMQQRILDIDPKECFFVDCGRTYRGEPATVISGLNYLEGETVVALADGNVIKDLEVENGSITLPIPASIVTVGLPYESVLETLTFDANSGDGSYLNRKKRVAVVSVHYLYSRNTKISINGHREVEMLKRGQEGFNIPISLKSGFYRENIASTHSEKTNIKVRQDDPLPVTVISVIAETEYEQ